MNTREKAIEDFRQWADAVVFQVCLLQKKANGCDGDEILKLINLLVPLGVNPPFYEVVNSRRKIIGYVGQQTREAVNTVRTLQKECDDGDYDDDKILQFIDFFKKLNKNIAEGLATTPG